MSIFLCMDVEASGPCPLHGDMISFAAVQVSLKDGIGAKFASGNMRPECDKYSESAYASIGMTRDQHLNAPYSIEERMIAFRDWLTTIPSKNGRYIMLSDNPGFDFGWVNFELWNKLGEPLLGHSARRIGDVWSGMRKRDRDTREWRKYRRTTHDHDPLNDATGNAEAWVEMWRLHG